MFSYKPYTDKLQEKIDTLSMRKTPLVIGDLNFSSPLLLAPMASICNAPFRLVMQELGAGGSMSEFVSCDGITHGNKRTLEMLRIDHREKNIGIQIFGDDAELMSEAAVVCEDRQPEFIDINMGCPVKKVVNKGGGSALLRDVKKLGPYLETIKKKMSVPLTIKIRMGWDQDQVNADEICHIAYESGVNMVTIHGRTRTQQYTGKANWEYIEDLSTKIKLPLIGNGDLHQAYQVRERMDITNCEALMIARGCLRNPFIFLESYMTDDREFLFTASDYYEVLERFSHYVCEYFDRDQIRLIQVRKLIMWFVAGFKGAAAFRADLFTHKSLEDVMKYTEDFLMNQAQSKKFIDYSQSFMTSGHG